MQALISRWLAIFILSGLLVTGMSPAQAGEFPGGFISFEFGCNATTYSVEIDRTIKTTIAIFNSDTEELLDEDFYPQAGEMYEVVSGTLTYPPQGTPTRLTLIWFYEDYFFGIGDEGAQPREIIEPYRFVMALEFSPDLVCDDDADGEEGTSTPTDNRFCFVQGEARVAVYPDYSDPQDPGVSIWRVTDQNTGVRVIDVKVSELNRLGDVPVNTLVSEDLFSAVKLYKLANGWYQINAGPYGEPKIHVCLFNSIPPTQVIKYTIEY